MKVFKIFFVFSAVLAILAMAGDISAKKKPQKEMKCEQCFSDMDADRDGKISKQEFTAEKCPYGNSEDIFNNRDADKDGFLTKEEFCSKEKCKGKCRERKKSEDL